MAALSERDFAKHFRNEIDKLKELIESKNEDIEVLTGDLKEYLYQIEELSQFIINNISDKPIEINAIFYAIEIMKSQKKEIDELRSAIVKVKREE